MVTYVLDASTLLRFFDNEPGTERIREIINDEDSASSRLLISSVQWGEIASVTCRRQNEAYAKQTLNSLLTIGIEVISASAEHAVRAGIIQGTHKVPYADSFAVALTECYQEAILITADFDFKAVEHLISIEFLPRKPVAP